MAAREKYLLPEALRNYDMAFGEYDALMRERCVLIAEACGNFTDEQVARTLDKGMTLDEAIADILEREAEAYEYARIVESEDAIYRDHDYSMNG